MQTLFSEDDRSPDDEDLKAEVAAAADLLHTWSQRALFATMAFGLTCASVVPFLAGHSLHNRWESVGKRLLIVAMGGLIVFAYCGGTAISFWYYKRSLEKSQS